MIECDCNFDIKEYHTKTGKRIRLIHGDCMEWMKGCGKYDLAIIDPPYGIGKRIKGTWGKETGMNEAVKWDEAPKKEFFELMFSSSLNQIVWGANYFIEHLYSSMGVVCWDKMNGTNNLSDFEFAWTSFNEKTARFFRMHHFSSGYDSKIHPTQKPVKLYRWLLQNYAKEGDRIFDSHGGSMSHAIACWEEDFELDIIELDKDYYDSAVRRFEQHISQKTLF